MKVILAFLALFLSVSAFAMLPGDTGGTFPVDAAFPVYGDGGLVGTDGRNGNSSDPVGVGAGVHDSRACNFDEQRLADQQATRQCRDEAKAAGESKDEVKKTQGKCNGCKVTFQESGWNVLKTFSCDAGYECYKK